MSFSFNLLVRLARDLLANPKNIIVGSFTMRLGFYVSVLVLCVSIGSPLAADTLGYWRFEEGPGSGIVDDWFSYDRDGTTYETPVYSTDVPTTPFSNSYSMAFSGDDYIQFLFEFPFHNPGDVTLEFWYNRPADGYHQSILWTRLNSSDANRYNIYRNGSFSFDYYGVDGSRHYITPRNSSALTLPANTWTHVAMVREANVYSVYLDGSLAGTYTDTTSGLLPQSGGWMISGRNNYMLRGLLDEVRISSGALDPSQFLLNTTPIPEPTMLTLFAFGATALLCSRIRRRRTTL
jgi:hypothetical protein